MATIDRPGARAALARLGAVAVVGLAVGVLTSYLQGVLPDPANFTANSGAVWTVVAFGLAWWVVREPHAAFGLAVAAGVAALVAEVVGYYAVAAPLRDIATTPAERVLWATAGFVVGSVTGAGAYLARHGRPGQRTTAFGALCGVVVGEGLHAAVRLEYAGQAGIEFAAGLAGLVATVWWTGRTARGAVVAILAAAVVALAVFAAYGVA